MAKTTGYSVQQKLDIVSQFQKSGLSQDAFVCGHPAGISSRTLRDWIALVRRPDRTLERQQALVEKALRDWTAVSKAMGAVGDVPASEPHEVPAEEPAVDVRAVPTSAPAHPGRLAMPPSWLVW